MEVVGLKACRRDWLVAHSPVLKRPRSSVDTACAVPLPKVQACTDEVVMAVTRCPVHSGLSQGVSLLLEMAIEGTSTFQGFRWSPMQRTRRTPPLLPTTHNSKCATWRGLFGIFSHPGRRLVIAELRITHRRRTHVEPGMASALPGSPTL